MFIMNAEKTKIVNLSNVSIYLLIRLVTHTISLLLLNLEELQRSQSILHDHWQQKQWIELLNH